MVKTTKAAMTTEQKVEAVAELLRFVERVPAQLKKAREKVLENRKISYESPYGFTEEFNKSKVQGLKESLESVIYKAQEALEQIKRFEEVEDKSTYSFTRYVPAVFGTFNVSNEVKGLEEKAREIKILDSKQEAELRLLTNVLYSDEARIYQEAYQIAHTYNSEHGFYLHDEVKVEAVRDTRRMMNDDGLLDISGKVTYLTEEYFTVSYKEGEGKKAKTVSENIHFKDALGHRYQLVSVTVTKENNDNRKYFG